MIEREPVVVHMRSGGLTLVFGVVVASGQACTYYLQYICWMLANALLVIVVLLALAVRDWRSRVITIRYAQRNRRWKLENILRRTSSP